ncbi:hypothetical protein GCM10009565_80500 [Amycolatopsis albidoflavus]
MHDDGDQFGRDVLGVVELANVDLDLRQRSRRADRDGGHAGQDVSGFFQAVQGRPQVRRGRDRSDYQPEQSARGSRAEGEEFVVGLEPQFAGELGDLAEGDTGAVRRDAEAAQQRGASRFRRSPIRAGRRARASRTAGSSAVQG